MVSISSLFEHAAAGSKYHLRLALTQSCFAVWCMSSPSSRVDAANRFLPFNSRLADFLDNVRQAAFEVILGYQ